MSLKDLKLPTDTVEVPGGGSFAVRGLSSSDLMTLLGAHSEQLSELFGIFSKRLAGARVSDGAVDPSTIDLSGIDLVAILRDVVREAPTLVAGIIWTADAHWTGDPADMEAAKRLPVLVQIEAIEKIGKLTFNGGGTDGKKALEAALALFQSATAVATDLLVLKSGSARSDAV